jgi:hypothetical protein
MSDILVVSKITNRRTTRVLPTASIIIFYKLSIMLQKSIFAKKFYILGCLFNLQNM